MAQQDWKKRLKADPTDWLLEESDPGVRYLALRDIADGDEKEVKAARAKAHRERPIAVILDNMNPAGYWIAAGSVYANKCRGPVWSVISLAELGATVEEDKRVGVACDYIIKNSLLKSGQFSPGRIPNNMGLCLQGNMLISLPELGCKDKRLETAYEYAARRVTGEGLPQKVNMEGLGEGKGVSGPFRYINYPAKSGFICRTNKGLPCGWEAAKVLLAFANLPGEKRTEQINKAIDIGVNFFLSGDPSKAEFPGHRGGAPDIRWWQFQFPSFWGADILQIAEALTKLGYGQNPRLSNTIDLILSKQNEQGRWPLEWIDHSHKMWVKYGTLGKPNKWVTLRALRVLKRAAEY
ncbi:MAG: nitrogen fixation protein NifH [Dehalococcoidales bacterium]|nr:nitrogen fixation protein NifH [Dehalococcoidales bacterium]